MWAGDAWGPASRGGRRCVSQTDTVAGRACDVAVACDVAGGKRPLHVVMGPGHIEGHVERGWTHGKGPKCVGTCQYTSKHIRTMVGGLEKALVHGYTLVQVGVCQHRWARIGGVSVQHVRAMGACWEGMGISIGSLGVARCGRSGMGSRESAWHEGPEVCCWEAGTHMGHAPHKRREGVTDEVGGWANGQTGAGGGEALEGGVTASVEVGKRWWLSQVKPH